MATKRSRTAVKCAIKDVFRLIEFGPVTGGSGARKSRLREVTGAAQYASPNFFVRICVVCPALEASNKRTSNPVQAEPLGVSLPVSPFSSFSLPFGLPRDKLPFAPPAPLPMPPPFPRPEPPQPTSWHLRPLPAGPARLLTLQSCNKRRNPAPCYAVGMTGRMTAH